MSKYNDLYVFPSTDDLQQSSAENSAKKQNEFPPEIIFKILEFQFYQIMQNNTSSISFNTGVFIKSNLTVSQLFYNCVQKIIYKYCTFKTPHTFDTFLTSINHNNQLGEFVKVLDFQEFTSIGLGRTGRMNKEIQMVTSQTILNCLMKTPNLMEFLASENIKDDLDTNLLNYLFNKMNHLKSVDFCGCSGENFVSNFDKLIIKKPGISNITNLSFHDCTDLSPWILEKILINLPNITKLDLTHTQITSKTLNLIPKSARLTHLSLAYCIQLTTRELIHFFINHPAITSNQLVWLNLQCDSSTNSPLSNNQLTFLLKMFDCDFNYLNLGGLPVTFENLMLIKKKFINLKSLCIANNNIDIDSLIEFLKPPKRHNKNNPRSSSIHSSTSSFLTYPSNSRSSFSLMTSFDQHSNQNIEQDQNMNEDDEDESINYYQQLEYIDLTNNREITRWTIDNPKFLNCCPSLMAFEFSIKLINDIESIGGVMIHSNDRFERITWKTYDSLGRRGWLFKVDDERNPDNLKQMGIIHYDVNTGQRLFKILRLPIFLRLVNKKISLSKGVLFDSDEVFGDFERGIYKYYGLKM